MIIKAADDKATDIQHLEMLLLTPGLDRKTSERIRKEIRTANAGAKGEADAAYQIDFYYRDSRNIMIIHDLRLEHEGRVAQIDHLIINRLLDIWVCESKSFAEGVSINEHGEWSRYYAGRPQGIASPIEQNRRHIRVLDSVFSSRLVELPKRLGIPIKPNLHSLILVSESAHIKRPRPSAQVDGLDEVIKCDQLTTTLDRQVDQKSVAFMLKVVGQDAVENLARSIADRHVPGRINWEAKFAMPATPQPTIPLMSVTGAADAEFTARPAEPAEAQCVSCGKPLSDRVVDYCRVNSARFGGQLRCWDCQRARRRMTAS